MYTYLHLLKQALEHGVQKTDRTNTGTRSLFGYQMRFDLNDHFPLLTTKKIHLKSVIYELLWFLRGDTNVKWLNDRGVSIWDEWASAEQCRRFGRNEGDLGPIYGHQWRNFGASHDGEQYLKDGCDQIKNLIRDLRLNPDSRRLIVTGWNPRESTQVALPPCHTLFQFYVAKRKLSCQLYQRSGDIFLGIPFNIASYSLLTLMLAHITGLSPGEFIHTIGDAHLYENHIEQAKLQLSRIPRTLPRVHLRPQVKELEEFTYEHFHLEGYDPYPPIKAKVAI